MSAPEFRVGTASDDKNFKSCFARSVAVNSQYKQTKSLDFTKVTKNDGEAKTQFVDRDGRAEIVRFRKNTRNHSFDDSRRFSCGNIIASRRSSLCTSRIAEIPVDNFVNQSKIETLQWQLKERSEAELEYLKNQMNSPFQIEKSREMYKAVMRQVVTFLERAHHSLELLGSRLNHNRKGPVPRSKSDHQIRVDTNGKCEESNSSDVGGCLDGTREFSWQPPRKRDPPTEETPPDKLSREAFRLLRTAQSLLNTNEPDLAHLDPPAADDDEFLSQLAREFRPPAQPRRATSFSLGGPKPIRGDAEVPVSTALNRKLSLQLGGGAAAGRRSPADQAKGGGGGSPEAGSVSSAEDESGFSSMNSFQDVGVPLVNSTFAAGHGEEVSAKHALLRSMLHNTSDFSSLSHTSEQGSPADSTLLSKTICERSAEENRNSDDVKLWQKPCTTPPVTPQHKRWYSTPVDDSSPGHSMKVLWV